MKEIPVTALRPLWFAKWCVLVPLGLGLVAFAGFLAVGGRDRDLVPFAQLGLLAMGIGMLAVVAGSIALVAAMRRGAPMRSIALRGGMLLANVALAGLCVRATLLILALQVVEIVNESRVPATALHIQGKNTRWASLDVPLLPPGSSRRWVFEAGDESGDLTFAYRQGERDVVSGDRDPAYLMATSPATIRLVIRDGGEHQIAVTDAARWHWLALFEGLLER